MPHDITMEEVRRMAADAGLVRLTDEHLRELQTAIITARQRRAALPTGDLVPADEPAHVFNIKRHAQP